MGSPVWEVEEFEESAEKSVAKLGELIAERHHYCREFRSINDFILRNWGHVLTPFLDTYPGIGKE